MKNRQDILEKLGIAQLNPMQEEALRAIHSSREVVLLSPTGTGKTLAFLLPLIAELQPEVEKVQLLILVPARELAIQIEQVVREMGTGHKVNAVYGGQAVAKDKKNLQHPPAILIGTPGRVADHFRRGTFAVDGIRALVLDEFDKSLEIGFADEMSAIISELVAPLKKVLTSATQKVEIPEFVELQHPLYINYLEDGLPQLLIHTVVSPDKDKLDTLLLLLQQLGPQPGIVFCNFRNAIERVSSFLEEHGVAHGCFHGGMEQQDRERALIKFRNGTHQLLVATDLAARGIDIPEIEFIIHYHLPLTLEEFTHRNGRTARMQQDGTAYVLYWHGEPLPDFLSALALTPYPLVAPAEQAPAPDVAWTTLFISGGRRDKISKGDIAGLFFKQGHLQKEQLGTIELKQDCAFVAVATSEAADLIARLNNSKLKNKKVRISEV